MSDSFNTENLSGAVQSAARKYEITPNNTLAMVQIAKDGMPASAFAELLHITGLTKDELAAVLGLSYKTVQRYEKENKRFNALNSEQLAKIIALYQKANEIFTDLNAFNRWLRKPAYGLGDQVPVSLLSTSGGIDLIREELIRIEYGALA
ncbi:putative toxin-antitoxin system antitoxin component, TIGR02293 family [Cyclonatronum proteinivorum]|uniref:Putative toxin-antitoxin system antitoxin component, TIGR02293 family n=1 Tax=Cyclonatronum proteinivorum TaxID=1457365 RepID=A0A345UL53_9BACT|nr:antitoxin Xre/MbcA/ParS toxin-binding domain-containing protein [Cyclonatronum proteinivorum]AXJ01205.1 putative toxin-antitoxin system antitoxin component, TIGR02293 family [Cyclonatronum proteinivorum]